MIKTRANKRKTDENISSLQLYLEGRHNNSVWYVNHIKSCEA